MELKLPEVLPQQKINRVNPDINRGAIKCLVVDDEILSRRGLIKRLKTFDCIEVIGEAKCVESFIEAHHRYKPDLVFMDIMLRDKNIMEYFSELHEIPMLVFVSAYSHFALHGFELQAVDYLLKPVSENRLNLCIDKIRNQYFNQMKFQKTSLAPLYLRSNGKLFKVLPNDIFYIKSMENYVVIHLEHKTLIVKMTLEQILKQLPEHQFMQVHRCFVVSSNKIECIEKGGLRILNDLIPISRSKRKFFLNHFLGDGI